MASSYNQKCFNEISKFQRWYVRSEYKFLRRMGTPRLIAKDSMYRTACHIYLAGMFGGTL